MTLSADFLRFIKYALVGAVGTIVQYLVLFSAVSLLHIMTPVSATICGAILGAIVNYILNAKYTFAASGISHRAAFPKFAVAAMLGVILNGVLMKVLNGYWGVPYMIAQLIASAAVLFLTYFFNRFWTFKEKEPVVL